MARVGERTFSMTRPNGSRTPLSSRASRSAIKASNLEKRSPPWRRPAMSRRPGPSACGAPRSSVVPQLLDRVDELADRLDLHLHVHRDEDVELVLDRRDEIHDGEAVPFEIAGKGRGLGERHALLVERRDQLGDLAKGLVSVGHRLPLWSRHRRAKGLGPKRGGGLAGRRRRAMFPPSRGKRWRTKRLFRPMRS